MTDDDAIVKKLGARLREQNAETDAEAPFDDATADRIASRLLGDSRDSPAAKAPSAPKAPARVFRFPRMAGAVVPLAAAAALLLYVSSRGASDGPPAYELGVVTESAHRADPATMTNDATLDPAGDIELVARPAFPTKDVHVQTVVVRDGVAKPWHVPATVSNEGAVRIHGPTRDLFSDPTGHYEIVVVVAKGETSPSEEDALRLAQSGETPRNVRVLRARVGFAEKN